MIISTTNLNYYIKFCDVIFYIMNSDRKQVLNKLLEILNLKNSYDMVYLDELEKDLNKQKQILDLVDDVKKYFSYSNWEFFENKKDIKHPYLSLAKSIVADMGLELRQVNAHDTITRKIVRKGYSILF